MKLIKSQHFEDHKFDFCNTVNSDIYCLNKSISDVIKEKENKISMIVDSISVREIPNSFTLKVNDTIDEYFYFQLHHGLTFRKNYTD